MKEFVFDYQEGILKGLRTYGTNSGDAKSLTRSQGLFPYATNVLMAHPTAAVLDLSFLGCTFPYPQVFVTSLFIIVCTETMIFESLGINPAAIFLQGTGGQLVGTVGDLISLENLVMKQVNLTPGEVWTLVDFQSYVALSNGSQTVVRDASTGLYTVSDTFPRNSCIMNTEGQVLIGAPHATQTMGNIDKTGFTFFQAILQSKSSLQLDTSAVPDYALDDAGNIIYDDAGDPIL